jgi:NTP pyrophosphatase (non-canonical NTP hydrolase)
MPELKTNAQIKDYQVYVYELESERGFLQQSIKDKCLLLGEEVGELFKSIRKVNGIAVDPNSKFGEVEDEIADIFIYLCSISNRLNIDIEKAFINKEIKNKKRKWEIL